MPGGDLLNLLIERDIFEEGFTRFYLAEVRSVTIVMIPRLQSTADDIGCGTMS